MVKEKSCLITQNLIGAVEWFLTAPNTVIKPERGGDEKLTWAEKAKQDLINTINRVKTPFPIEASWGVQLETQIYKYANAETFPEHFSPEFKQLCEMVKGYEFYKKGGVNLEICGNNCYIFGKYDAIKLPKIIDLKTTSKYSEDKYLKGIQHKLYCYITGAKEFDYVVALWEEYPKIKSIHIERYQAPEQEVLKKEITSKIEETISIIKDIGEWENYRNKYCLY